MYKQLQTFSRFLFVPKKVSGGTVCVSAVDNTVVSLLDTLERGILLHFFSSTLICNKKKKKKRKSDKIVIIIFQSLLFSPYSKFKQSRKDQSSPQTSNKILLKHPLHKSSPLTVQLQPQEEEPRSHRCLHCSPNWDLQSPARRATSITRLSLPFLQSTVVS